MMLIAIGIYKTSQKNSYVKLQAAPLVQTGLHAYNALANFETHTLATLNDFEKYEINIIDVSNRREFHYLKKIDNDTMMVIVSKTFIECTRERPELYMLQRNIELAYKYPDRTGTSLQDILDNPPAYISRDILTDSIQKQADELKDEALKALDALIKRGENIRHLLYDTQELVNSTRSFHIETKNLNRGCCW